MLFVLFLLSGFVGVLAEQVFEKLLSVVVGGTTPAAATVISVYFVGLSAGGWLSSVFLKRTSPSSLRFYGLCELGVALACAVVWATFSHLVPWYAPLLSACGSDGLCLSVVRGLISATIVLPAAVCMGLSFPFLSDLASCHEAPAHFLAKLYSANLLGAALCAIVAPYLIFPWIGLSGALFIAIGLDCVVGVTALRLSRREQTGLRPVSDLSAAGVPRTPPLTRRGSLILGIAFLTGLIFFALEVLWTHLTGVVAGTSVYAFSSMLFIVLFGLALGSLQIAKAARNGKPPAKIGALFFLSASLLLLQVVFWPYIPAAIPVIGSVASGFYTGELVRLTCLVALLLPFTYAFGRIYPCLFNEQLFGGEGTGRLVGRMGFANALGCVLGAAVGFFGLIPELGAESSLRLITVLLASCGVVMLWLEGDSKNLRPSLVSGSILALFAFGYPSWDRNLLTSGMNVYFGSVSQLDTSTSASASQGRTIPTSRLTFFHEDANGGMTTVREETNGETTVRVLLTNGKFQGDDGREVAAQTGFAVIPALHLSNHDRALVIGCGSGQSAGVLNAIGFEQVDLAELAPGILEAARSQFSHVNLGFFDSPRSRVLVEDGRNILLRRNETYDLIGIEVSSIWFAGATNIYSHEFYELAKKRLRPSGVLQQWIQLHHIGTKEVNSIVGTIRESFPSVSVWVYGGQGVILASLGPVQINEPAAARVKGFLINRHHGNQAAAGKVLEAIVASKVLSDENVDAMLREAPPIINSDWNRWLEYSTPRYNITDVDWGAVNIARLRSFSSGGR